MIDAKRLTDLELVRIHTAVTRELDERRAARARARHERQRADRMERTSIGETSPRSRREPVRNRKPGDGGRVVGIDRERGVRLVECTTCPVTFEAPLRRGRAPRDCQSCRGLPVEAG